MGLKSKITMVDNSEQIRKMLTFNPNDFYFVEVVKRRKDNPNLSRSEKVIRNFYIDSFENYDNLLPIIIKLCDFENARAYLRINKRNYQKLALPITKRIVEYMICSSEKSIRTVFDSVAGEIHSDSDPKWIVDFDNESVANIEMVKVLTELQIEADREPMNEIIPTKSGLHIITRPLNLSKFRELYPAVDVHKDNMVILYCPMHN